MKFKEKPKDLSDDQVRKSIRDRIVPPAAMVGDRSIPEVETAKRPEGDYEEDLKKLEVLTEDQIEKLLTQVEKKSRGDQALFSKGDLLNGYAIDRETLQSLQSRDHSGVHKDLAGIEEKAIIDELKSHNVKNVLEYVDRDAILRRIVQGMVYFEVPGFKTPILKLYLGLKEIGNELPKEDVERIVGHLKQEKKLLPIDQFCRAL